jgi:hypothetical protein
MVNINERLADVKYRIKEKDRLNSLVQSIETQKGELERKKDALFRQLRKEEIDVEKLEGLSFTNLFHKIKGDKNDRLYDERKEALAAKLKYDEACLEIGNLIKEMDCLKDKISALGDLEKEYDEIIKEKENLIKSGGYNELNELNNLIEKQIDLKNREKEINEALSAGNIVIDSLKQVENSLHSASNWGVYDMLGGGFISTMAKHSKIDEAKDEIDRTQSMLRKFHRDLKDVGSNANINIEIGSFLTFADYFFDGLFADWSVQNRISDAEERVFETQRRVSELINMLERDMRITQSEFKNLEGEKIRIIENA